jgi:putative ABC transport system permease protein
MNLVVIAWKSIRQRALASSLTALSVALGVTLMVSVLVIGGVMDKMFSQTASGYDLVIGAKGSGLQLVLNTIYHVGSVIENVPYTYYKRIKSDPRVTHAIPFALGDVTQEGNFRIVGTINEYFEIDYIPGRQFGIKGHLFESKWDAIIGSQVARQNGWDIGSQFSLVHGGAADHVHDEKFTVVGILAPTGTPNDKACYVNLSGFYEIAGHETPLEEAQARARAFAAIEQGNLPPAKVEPEQKDAHEEHAHEHGAEEHGHDHAGHDHHGHHHHHLTDEQKEVTAILIQTVHPNLVRLMAAEINNGPLAQAANPAFEMRWLLSNVLGNIRIVLVVLTSLIIIVSGVSIFVSIYNSMADRRREIAVMRALGARRSTVFAIILAESILLCVGGGILGILLGHGIVLAASPIVEARSGILLNPYAFVSYELIVIPALIALAALVGVIPGMSAYRTDVAKTLAS